MTTYTILLLDHLTRWSDNGLPVLVEQRGETTGIAFLHKQIVDTRLSINNDTQLFH